MTHHLPSFSMRVFHLPGWGVESPGLQVLLPVLKGIAVDEVPFLLPHPLVILADILMG